MTSHKRTAAVIAGAGLLIAAAAAAQTVKAPIQANTQVAGANQLDIQALRNDINALKAENAALKSDIALLKTQVGNAVAINVTQGASLTPLVAQVNDLEHRYNRHKHMLKANQYDGMTKSIARIKTGEPSEHCTTSGTYGFTCTFPPKP